MKYNYDNFVLEAERFKSPYDALAAEILVDAAEDWLKARTRPDDKKARLVKTWVEEFFHSELYRRICGIDGDALIAKLESKDGSGYEFGGLAETWGIGDREDGGKRPRREPCDLAAHDAEIREMAARGLSRNAIAEKINATHKAVARYVDREGIAVVCHATGRKGDWNEV